MAKTSAAASAGRTAEELKTELRRLVRSIEDDTGTAETFKEAARVLEALKGFQIRHRNGGAAASDSVLKRSSPLSPGKPPQPPDKIDRTAEIPDQFICPISSELLQDPVVLVTGESYDRRFIELLFNSGKRTCPRTQQIISDLTLTPNNLLRRMISDWCADRGITNVVVDDGVVVTREDRDRLTGLLNMISNGAPTEAIKELRQLTRMHSSHRAMLGENPAAILKLISVPIDDPDVWEDTVTTILNLSINDSNKKTVAEITGVIPFLIESFASGTMESRSNASAALFTLSAVDSNKTELGAMGPLVLVEHESVAAKRDAASAIFNLCVQEAIWDTAGQESELLFSRRAILFKNPLGFLLHLYLDDRKSFIPMNRQEVLLCDWEILPLELLQLILGKVEEIGDYVRFDIVCKSWRVVVNSDNLPPQFPWLLLPYVTNDTLHRFWSCPTGRIYSDTMFKFYLFKSTEGKHIVALIVAFKQLLYSREQYSTWITLFFSPPMSIRVVSYHNERFYSYPWYSRVAACKFGPEAKFELIPSLAVRSLFTHCYLAVVADKLLLVLFHNSEERWSFDVYKLDDAIGQSNWTKIHDIGEHALFLTSWENIVVAAAGKTSGCGRNRIYLCDVSRRVLILECIRFLLAPHLNGLSKHTIGATPLSSRGFKWNFLRYCNRELKAFDRRPQSGWEGQNRTHGSTYNWCNSTELKTGQS